MHYKCQYALLFIIISLPFIFEWFQKNKKGKKKKKKIGKVKHDVDEEPVKKTKVKSPRLQEESDESQDTQRTKKNGSIVMSKKGKKKSPGGVENQAFDAQDFEDNVVVKHNKLNKKSPVAWELDSESEPEIVVAKKKTKKTKKTLANDNEAEYGVELSARRQNGLSVSRSSQLELSQDEGKLLFSISPILFLTLNNTLFR